ncbi:hypothetical protein SCLCIDRAFT_109091 [Scleroderma citrinum Foug A]|uniref:Uncharacterized protein n=1 Tax=Scleroderma citrinum Foug A TaxID=1036808 RepID=A0A0C3EGJ6_9AGAM|nr:hypothetical protein SCLCIDRAFT_109091 [Scleroderma citrinum Foug A]
MQDLSHEYYPFRKPRPYSSPPREYRKAGIRIEDVGVVLPDDSFDVFFKYARGSTRRVPTNTFFRR